MSLRKSRMDVFQGILMKGKSNAVCAERLEDEIFVNHTKGNAMARIVIKDLIYDRRIPVGSCDDGFYIISNEDELKECLASLRGRADEILHRANTIEKNYREANS